MRTLRILLTIFMLMFLTFGISNAQSKKNTETFTWDWVGPAPCSNEDFVGVESCIVTTSEGRYRCRYEGTYKGSDSGKTYKMDAFEFKFSFKKGAASNETFFFKSVLRCEGIPIAIGFFTSHLIINANGEIVVERERGSYWEWICL